MKTTSIKSALKNTCFAVTTIAMLAGSTQAQSNDKQKETKRERAVKNYIFNFNQENPGVRDTSIVLVGEYKLTETTDALINLLNTNEEPNTRILVANSLLKIGDKKGIDAIREMVSSEKNKEVKEVFAKVINDYENLESLKITANVKF